MVIFLHIYFLGKIVHFLSVFFSPSQEIPEDQEESIKKTLEEKTKYKEVAPTWELNIETYGYGKNFS